MFDHCTKWRVVINLEEQYSIWPAELPTPMGWKFVKMQSDTKKECLNFIKEHWLDMKPYSLIEESIK